MDRHSPRAHAEHHHPSRRDFFHQLLGGALAGASVLEMAFRPQ